MGECLINVNVSEVINIHKNHEPQQTTVFHIKFLTSTNWQVNKMGFINKMYKSGQFKNFGIEREGIKDFIFC